MVVIALCFVNRMGFGSGGVGFQLLLIFFHDIKDVGEMMFRFPGGLTDRIAFPLDFVLNIFWSGGQMYLM